MNNKRRKALVITVLLINVTITALGLKECHNELVEERAKAKAEAIQADTKLLQKRMDKYKEMGACSSVPLAKPVCDDE